MIMSDSYPSDQDLQVGGVELGWSAFDALPDREGHLLESLTDGA